MCFSSCGEKNSYLEKEFGARTCVEKPKKNGVINNGPYLVNRRYRRALGNGGWDILTRMLIYLLNGKIPVKAPPLVYEKRMFIVQTTGSMIFQSSFFSFLFLRSSALCICTKDFTFFSDKLLFVWCVCVFFCISIGKKKKLERRISFRWCKTFLSIGNVFRSTVIDDRFDWTMRNFLKIWRRFSAG